MIITTALGSDIILISPQGIHVYDELNYFTSSDVFIFSQQISSAMECLSRQGMIHKDLSCRNIYITNAKVLKLTSFGIVKDRPHQEVYYNGEPLRWMAMESILGSSYSSASDVWSFGIVLWELITLGDFPYEHVMNEDLLSFLMSGKRLDIPVGCSNEFFSILQSCWQNDPNRRPTFSHLHKTFLDYFTKKNFDHLIQISSASIKHSCSTDSAIGTSPTIPEVIESSTTNNESITSQRPIDVIIRPSFTNPTFRKDSMDIPDELKIPSGRGKISTTNKSASMSSVVSTNLDSPNKVITKDTPIIYETIPGDNTTEV
jgi:serine/threonine protein kinase